MRGALLLGLVVGGCAEDVGTGPARSSAHPTARSATTTVENVELLQPIGVYRRWTIELLEDAPGTPCLQRGAPLLVTSIYTLYSSAPRGYIPLSLDPPPILFPAAYAVTGEGLPVQGAVSIDAAASTLLVGALSGYATLDGAVRAVDVQFESPTCAP